MRSATLFRGVISWLVPVLVLAACDTGTEPELQPEGWQVVMGVSYPSLSLAIANAVVGKKVEAVRFLGRTEVFDLPGDGDTIYVGYEHWTSGSEGIGVEVLANLALSPTTRHPIVLHEPVIFAETYDPWMNRTGVAVNVVPVSGPRPTTFSHQFSEASPTARVLFLWPITCQKEGTNVLRGSGLRIRFTPGFAGEFHWDTPNITVTCHRQVSAASRVAG